MRTSTIVGISVLSLVLIASAVFIANQSGDDSPSTTYSDSGYADSDSTIVVDVEDGKSEMKTIELHSGQYYDIVLDSNPTTGYDWHVVDSKGLTCLSNYILDPSSEGMVGVGGKQVFTIMASQPGEYRFVATYDRIWESEPVETVEYKFIVDEKIYIVNDGSIYSIPLELEYGSEWSYESDGGIRIDSYADAGTQYYYVVGIDEGEHWLKLKLTDDSGKIIDERSYSFIVVEKNPYSDIAVN